MDIKIRKKYGNAEIAFDFPAKSLTEAILYASIFTSQDKCTCGGTNIALEARRAKEYIFVNRRCTDCNLESALGEYRAGGYYWKPWEAPYQGNEGGSVEKTDIKPETTENSGVKAEDDLPF